MITRPEKTAISRSELSAPAKKLLELGCIQSDSIVLDYGCGKGGDVVRLEKMGYEIYGYDAYIFPYNAHKEQINPTIWSYDVVYSFYVMNVIETPLDRWYTVERMKRLADTVIIAVRSDNKAVKPDWRPLNDGYMTTTGTFQKFYSLDEVYNEFSCYDWNLKILECNTGYIMFELRRV